MDSSYSSMNLYACYDVRAKFVKFPGLKSVPRIVILQILRTRKSRLVVCKQTKNTINSSKITNEVKLG